MVDPCGPNVVDGPFLWLNTRPVILGRAFDHICQPIARAAKKSPSQISYSGLQRVRKSQKTVRISPQLRRGVGRHRFPLPDRLTKTALAPNRAKAVKTILWSGRREVQGFASQTLVSLRAIGPCVLRWKMLTHLGVRTISWTAPRRIQASCGTPSGSATRGTS